MRVLLDSNAYSMLMRGHEQVAELVRSSEEILLSAVVVGELMYASGQGLASSETSLTCGPFSTAHMCLL